MVDRKYLERLRREMERDGYLLDEGGRVHPAQRPQLLRVGALAELTDAEAIREHLTRIGGAIQDDPALVVGCAKELIESTAKVVLRERGEPVDDKADVPALVKAAQEALRLHPSQHAAGPDGTDAVKKILGAASTLVLGVAELRNRGYGTGHGPVAARTGPDPGTRTSRSTLR